MRRVIKSIPAFLVTLVALSCLGCHAPQKYITVDLGQYTVTDHKKVSQGDIDALQRLSQILADPNKMFFITITWTTFKRVDRFSGTHVLHEIHYRRADRSIEYSKMQSNGTPYGYLGLEDVTDEAITAVAGAKGTFNDLKKHGAK